MAKKIIYTSEQRKQDEDDLLSAEMGKTPLNLSAFKRLMLNDLCISTSVLSNHRIGKHDISRIDEALSNPEILGQVLIDTSRYLVSVSSFYMRLMNYFAKMGLFNYIIDSYDIKNKSGTIPEKYFDDYTKVCSQFEKMNLKHEMQKIMPVLLSEDLFCGLIFENSSDFFILRMDSRICKIAQIQDGLFNFKINLSAIDATKISSFPRYLQQAYLDYKNGIQKDVWYVPPAENQICFKFNEAVPHTMPFLLMLVKDIFDLEIYKKLKLQKARVDNYKAIVIEIPIDNNTVDKPLLSEETISVFAEMNKANMPDDVGLIHTAGKAEAVSFKDNANSTNNLGDAIENLHDSAGVSNEMFNSGSTATAVRLSNENDAAFIYSFYRQCERFLSRFIKLRKLNKPNYKFAIRIHDSTVFNRDAVANSFLKAAQNGLPYKIDYAISLGQTQSRMMGALMLENEVLALHEKFIPLKTSYTTSGEEISGGRPTNESQGINLGDSGEATADKNANER